MFRTDPWQMSFGERAALVGILADLRPGLAIEIGTAEGGSLTAIAEHAGEVHSFDLVDPQLPVAGRPHVHLHTGDNHQLLPQVLAEFAAAGRHVDFALVDGDHSPQGVRRDMLDLIESDACRTTVIVMHDSANDLVRQGLEEAELDRHPKVGYVDLDFVSGYVFHGDMAGEIWGGLGLVLMDDAVSQRDHPPLQYHPPIEVLRAMRERDALVGRAERADRVIADLKGSASWRLTRPLRAAKQALGARRR